MGDSYYHSFIKANYIGADFQVSKGYTASFSIPSSLDRYTWNDEIGNHFSKEFDADIKKFSKELKNIWNDIVRVDEKLANVAKSFSYDSGYFRSLINSCRY